LSSRSDSMASTKSGATKPLRNGSTLKNAESASDPMPTARPRKRAKNGTLSANKKGKSLALSVSSSHSKPQSLGIAVEDDGAVDFRSKKREKMAELKERAERERAERDQALRENERLRAEIERLEAADAERAEQQKLLRERMETAFSEKKEAVAQKKEAEDRLATAIALKKEAEDRATAAIAEKKEADDRAEAVSAEKEREIVRLRGEEEERRRHQMATEDELKRLLSAMEAERVRSEQRECVLLRRAMDLEQRRHDELEAAANVRSLRARRLIDSECIAPLETIGAISNGPQIERLSGDLRFVDELIARCDRADRTESDEQSESERESYGEIDGPTHCGNCGRPLIRRRATICDQCGDRLSNDRQCVYCPRCDDVELFLCSECDEESECMECGGPSFFEDAPLPAVYDEASHRECVLCDDGADAASKESAFRAISEWDGRVRTLYETKLSAVLLGVESYADFEGLSHCEQEMVMAAICCLTAMRSICGEYARNYCQSNEWAQTLLAAHDEIVRMFHSLHRDESACADNDCADDGSDDDGDSDGGGGGDSAAATD